MPSRLPGVAFAALSAGYLTQTWVRGRFPHMDDAAYKAAGYHYAADGIWAAPELTGLIDGPLGVERLFAAYPPLYTFAFALAVRAAGMGWRTASVFDAVVHVLLSMATARLAGRLGAVGWAKWLPAIAVLPLGTVGRPDDLGMIFGLLGVMNLTGPDLAERWPGRAIRCGVGLGLAAACGPGVGVAYAVVTVVIAVGGLKLTTAVKVLAVAGLTSAAVAAAVFAPVLVQPGAVDQFLAHAHGYGAGDFWDGLLFSWRFGKWHVLCGLGLALTGAMAVLFAPRGDRRRLAAWWAGAAAATLWLLVSSPNRIPYFWFAGPVQLAVIGAAVQGMGKWRALPATVLGVGTVAVGAVPQLIQWLCLWAMPADQTWPANQPRVRSLIPTGAVVVADEYWWSLAGHADVLDANFAKPPDGWGRVTHVVRTGNGSGVVGKPIGFRPGLDEEVEQHFRVTSDTLNRQPLTVAGVRLTTSAYGFGTVIWTRISPAPASP